MASFTDKAPTFNPYVQQQPVEAMVRVGMHKQQQYDQGVQRIQSTIDSVAGMDIARDIDKSYLRSKLSEVGKKLNGFAAADYSNSELTRSLTGVVGSVANDPIVENAVNSTMVYKKGLADREAYTKEGKGSAANDWLFNSEAQAWLSSDDPKASFNSRYIPYTDYKKTALEIVKNVLKDENISETDYFIDAKGQIQFTDVTVREKVSGKSKAKIQSALMAGLSPNDWQQITIDGRYQYSNIDPERFQKEIVSSYENNSKNYLSEKNRLEGLIKASASPVEQGKLRQQLDYLNTQQGRATTEFQVMKQYFDEGNIEGAKAKLFTMNWMDNMGNSFSSQENSTELKKSVRAEFKFEREKEARRRQEFIWTFDQRDRHHRDDLKIKQGNLTQAELANKLKQQELLAASGYDAVDVSKDQKELFDLTPEVLQDQIEKADDKILQDINKLGQFYTSREEWEKEADKNLYPTYEIYAEEFVHQQRELWKQKPWAVKTKLRTFFDNEVKEKRVNDTRKFIRNQALDQGNARYNVSNILEEEDLNTVYNFTLNNGEEVSYTPEEIVEFNNKYDKVVFKQDSRGPLTVGAMRGSDIIDREKANKNLSKKEQLLLEIRFKEESESGRVLGNMSQEELAISDLILNYKKKYNKKHENLLNEKLEFQTNFIAERLSEMQGQAHSIDLTSSKKNMEDFKNVLTGFAENVKNQGGIAYSPGVDQASIDDIIPTLDSASIIVVRDVLDEEGNVTTKNIITARNKKGDKVTFVVPQDNMGWAKGRYDLSPNLQTFEEYKDRILATNPGNFTSGVPIGTTALDGKTTNKDNAYLNNIDFPNVHLFKVSGNLVSEDGMHYDIEFNVQNPVTGEWYENIEFTQTPQLDVHLLEQMQSLQDAQIFELLTGRKMTQEDLINLQNAAKNPQ